MYLPIVRHNIRINIGFPRSYAIESITYALQDESQSKPFTYSVDEHKKRCFSIQNYQPRLGKIQEYSLAS